MKKKAKKNAQKHEARTLAQKLRHVAKKRLFELLKGKGKAEAGAEAEVAVKAEAEGEAIEVDVKPEVPGPLQGVEVRVICESAGRSSLGLQGNVLRHKQGQVTLQLGATLQLKTLPEKAVMKVAGLRKLTMKQLSNISRAQKQQLLRRASVRTVGFDEGDELQPMVTPEKPELACQHVDLLVHFLRYQYGLEGPEVLYLSPQMTKAISDTFEDAAKEAAGGEEEVGAGEALQGLKDRLGHELGQAKLVLSAIFASGHYTLLAASRTESGWDLRYYETLTVEMVSCRAVAQAVLHVLRFFTSVPDRRNKFRQAVGSLTCGFWVCHYAEEELRAMLGAGWASLGWPDLSKQQQRLRMLLQVAEREMKTQKAEGKLQGKASEKASGEKASEEAFEKKASEVEGAFDKAEEQKASEKKPSGDKASEEASGDKASEVEGAVDKAEEEKASEKPSEEKASEEASEKKAGKADEEFDKLLKTLSAQAQAQVLKVQAKKKAAGCGRCQYSATGCSVCSTEKALRYWLRKEKKPLKGGGAQAEECISSQDGRCIYIYTHTVTYTYTHRYGQIYICTYIHIHTNTYIHKYKYTF